MRMTLCLGVSALAISSFGCGAALAQTAQPAQDSLLEELVVTAQKRSESVQDVPLSIQAFSSQQLAAQGVDDVGELQRLVPNFTASRGTSVSNLRLNIRGIGAAGNTAVDQSVAVFMDGVYVARPSALYASFLDIEGAEVVRGPQGTLFGRNTTAGGVILRSTDPKADFTADGLLEVGSYGRRKAEAVVNLPASDRIFLRAALQATEFDGYGRNITTGDRIGAQDSFAGRIGLGVEFNEDISWVLKADYSHITGTGQPVVEAIGSTIGAAQRTAFAARVGGAQNLPELADWKDRAVRQITDGNLNDSQYGLSSRLSWQLANGFELRLVSGYRDYDNNQFDGEVFFVPVSLLSRNTSLTSKSTSHELQFLSPDDFLDGKMTFVSGLYYFREELGIGEALNFNRNFCLSFAPAGAAQAACLAGPLEGATVQTFSQTAESWALFGQGDYKLTDQLSVQLGARFTRDEKEGSYIQTSPNPAGTATRAPENDRLKFSDEMPTYRLAVNWNPADDIRVFASYSTGYKAGGFNSGAGSTALGAERRTFDSEEAKNYELGFRGQFLERLLTLNATLYRTELDNFQDRSFDGTSFVVRNAGSLRHQGVEVDGRARLGAGFSLAGSAAYLDSEFTDFKTASAFPGCSAASPAIEGCGPVGGVRTVQDLTGKRAHYAPEWQGSLSLAYDHDLANGWTLNAVGGGAYVGEQFVGSVTDNNPQTLQKAYTLWNARLSVSSADDRWTFSVFGENLSDESYCPNIIYQPNDSLLGVRNPTNGGTLNRCFVAPPRTFGASIKVSY